MDVLVIITKKKELVELRMHSFFPTPPKAKNYLSIGPIYFIDNIGTDYSPVHSV